MKSTVAILPILSSLLTGCSMNMGLGNAEFSCRKAPGKPICMSAREVYAATEHTDRVPTVPLKGEKPSPPAPPKAVNGAPAGMPNAAPSAGVNPVLAAAPAPKIADPTPIRTPSQVMRIYVRPWEDGDGDLVASSYLFTEIEPRRWVMGEPTEMNLGPTLRPLQVVPRVPPKHTPNSMAKVEPPMGPPTPPELPGRRPGEAPAP